jgi:hypothetical protein
MTQSRRRNQRGQVLPLFAILLIGLFGVAALAIDVSGMLAAKRAYRSAADGASLAGAQDLQVTGSRAVTAAERIRARQHAMDDLVTQYGIVGALPAACDTSTDVDVTDACVLPGTEYHVSIRAGSYSGQPIAIACQNCDPARSVQVGLRNAKHELSFARLFGQSTWSVGSTSVAGLAFAKSYTLVTLRPPKDSGATYLVNDIILNGTGTVVNINQGDVGTNANMEYAGTGAVLNIDSGYGMFYFDPYFAPKWWTSPPIPPTQLVEQLPTLIPDPNYTYPAMQGSLGSSPCAGGGTNCAPTFTDARISTCGAPGANPACTRADLDPTGCGAEVTYLQTSVYTFMATQPLDRVYCYNPGIYDPSSNPDSLDAPTGDVVLLMPGAYQFKSPYGGLKIRGRLLGGYRPASGVALMFDECANQCVFDGNNAETIALNAGTKFPRGTVGTGATAAIDWNNQPVMTSGPASPTPAILMTLLVVKDPTCFVPTSPPFLEPPGCDPGSPTNFTINIGGGGQLDIEGVQYMPTDNVAIAGSSDGKGTVGQIIAWTVSYSGGTTLNQDGAGSQGPGTLRLDGACTAPGTPCNP